MNWWAWDRHHSGHSKESMSDTNAKVFGAAPATQIEPAAPKHSESLPASRKHVHLPSDTGGFGIN